MEKFAAIPEAAEAGLLVVFAHVWRKIGDSDCADVCGGLYGTDLFGGRVGVLLDE